MSTLARCGGGRGGLTVEERPHFSDEPVFPGMTSGEVSQRMPHLLAELPLLINITWTKLRAIEIGNAIHDNSTYELH